ncbi:transketolase [bacterium]|nr:transketolase [bacterium]
MRKTYEQAIYDLMGKNEKVVALVADSASGKYEDIEKDYPDRIFNFGIAENNMVAAGCALAKEGWIPVVYALNNFLVYRAYEFIRNDACLQKRNIKFVGLGCGVVANTLGPTHHTTEDIAALRVLPDLTLLSPASPKEVPVMLEKAIQYEGPVYIRLGKAFEKEIYEDKSPFEIGKANTIKTGSDITIFSTGSVIADVLDAAKNAQSIGISAEVINISTIKPLDTEAVLNSAQKTKNVLTVEEHNIIGGLAGAISETLLGKVQLNSFGKMGFNDVFCNDYGWHQDLKKMYGLSSEDIYNQIVKQIRG